MERDRKMRMKKRKKKKKRSEDTFIYILWMHTEGNVKDFMQDKSNQFQIQKDDWIMLQFFN